MSLKNKFPQEIKPEACLALSGGTAEAVPFQNDQKHGRRGVFRGFFSS
jgi:hypothetical protein